MLTAALKGVAGRGAMWEGGRVGEGGGVFFFQSHYLFSSPLFFSSLARPY